MTGGRRIDDSLLDEVRARTSLVGLIGRDIRLDKSGQEMAGLCPFHHEKTPSFTVVEKKGFWHCHGCGAHGDAIGWMMRHHGLSFPAAVEELAWDAGLMPPEPGRPVRPPKPPVERPSAAALANEELREIERARAIWREAGPAAGTLVEAYLASRGILVRELVDGMPPSIRFDPAMPYWVYVKSPEPEEGGRFERLGAWPAMVAGIQGLDGRVSGVHITYLAGDGLGKADLPPHPQTGKKLSRRKVRGAKAGGSIRFAPAARRLVLGEGVETVLSARFVRPDLACWSAVDLGNLAGGGCREDQPASHPKKPGAYLPSREPDMARPGIVLPDAVEEVLLLGETVNGDPDAYACLFERACRRLVRLGKRVFPVMPPNGDFNDWLMAAMGRAA